MVSYDISSTCAIMVDTFTAGFFTRDKDYYCAPCYQSNFGTKCNKCSQFVEGEVVTALGKTYHQACFRCAGCQKPFPTGERVTFTGKSCLCQVRSKFFVKPYDGSVSEHRLVLFKMFTNLLIERNSASGINSLPNNTNIHHE